MTSFDAFDLIALWEQDRGRSAAEKAAFLLRLACPERSPEELGAMTIGARDRVLLAMRRDLFGDPLEGVATCSECDEKLEMDLRVSDFLAGSPESPAESRVTLCVGEVDIEFRLPTAEDAVLAGRHGNDAEARRILLRRCVLSAGRDGAALNPEELDDITLARIARQMESLDPLSEIRLGFICFDCENEESVVLDIASYLWAELIGEVEQLLEEVRALARDYGWREADILAMSSRRRQFYLDRSAS